MESHALAQIALFVFALTGVIFFIVGPLFFARRHLWGRAFLSLALFGACLFLSYSEIFPVFEMLSGLSRTGVRLLLAGTVFLVPLILAEAMRLWFRRSVLRVENLLIKAHDTDGWSGGWRDRFVREHADIILANSTAIQREQVRNRHTSAGFLSCFAGAVLAEDPHTIAKHAKADREEPLRQLEHARSLSREGDVA